MRWLRALLGLRPRPLPARQRALDLIKAIDAGGLPLHPARVNDIARQLGLPVSKTEKVGDTVARIRAELGKSNP
jgi:DNA-binding IclR family transcriptional regulator